MPHGIRDPKKKENSMMRSNLASLLLFAPMLFAAELMELDFRRPCEAMPATAELLSGPGVTLPHMSPKWPPKIGPYPKEAKQRKESGVVEMLLLVNEEGYVTRAKVLKSSGSDSLDRFSLETTKDFRVEPGRVDGKATCMWMPFTSTWLATG
jgi:TonB family protein